MSSALELWNKLPRGFLRKSFGAWSQLDLGVRTLIVDLAIKQNFKCFFCDQSKNLYIEHDHDPVHGDGRYLSIYNIRGLACHSCNFHISLHERHENGTYYGLEDVYSRLSHSMFERYNFSYECRVDDFYEKHLEETVPNYWSRRLLLDKFDDWKEWGGQHSCFNGYEEVRARKRLVIKTPEQFLKLFGDCVKFVQEQIKNDPTYRPPEQFISVFIKVKSLIDDIRRSRSQATEIE